MQIIADTYEAIRPSTTCDTYVLMDENRIVGVGTRREMKDLFHVPEVLLQWADEDLNGYRRQGFVPLNEHGKYVDIHDLVPFAVNGDPRMIQWHDVEGMYETFDTCQSWDHDEAYEDKWEREHYPHLYA